MGWSDILDYLDNELLVFIDASGREFSNFIRKELPAFVADWKGSNARIVVDPLTPVLWSTKDLYEQRDLIGYMFKQTRKVGTVLCTLEEHGQADLAGPETVIPMYLADCVVHLKLNSNDADPSRLLKIVKCRNSRHSPVSHPFQIVRGLGIVIEGVDGPGRRAVACPRPTGESVPAGGGHPRVSRRAHRPRGLGIVRCARVRRSRRHPCHGVRVTRHLVPRTRGPGAPYPPIREQDCFRAVRLRARDRRGGRTTPPRVSHGSPRPEAGSEPEPGRRVRRGASRSARGRWTRAGAPAPRRDDPHRPIRRRP